MKKFENLGRSLSKKEQKSIKGGDETAQCTVDCTCSSTCIGRTSCDAGTTSCSATNNVSITCDGATYTCAQICAAAC